MSFNVNILKKKCHLDNIKNQILRNKFNQGGEDLYNEKAKISMKEIKGDTNKLEDICVLE